MRKVALRIVMVALAASAMRVSAAQLTLAAGWSDDARAVARVGIAEDWQRRWWQTDSGHLRGYWHLAYSYWQGDVASSNHSLALTPVFVYQFHGDGWAPFIEAGVGVALFSETRMENNNLGSAFQFEDRLGIGIRWDDGRELGMRVTHYSNAGLTMPNEGAECFSLFYRWRF